jgi:hypothetical protein
MFLPRLRNAVATLALFGAAFGLTVVSRQQVRGQVPEDTVGDRLPQPTRMTRPPDRPVRPKLTAKPGFGNRVWSVDVVNPSGKSRRSAVAVSLVSDRGQVVVPETITKGPSIGAGEKRSVADLNIPAHLPDGYYRASTMAALEDGEGTLTAGDDVYLVAKAGEVRELDATTWIKESATLFAAPKGETP